MPEAFAILAVFLVCVATYVALWLRARDPALHRPQHERTRLEHQVHWLEERREKARRENWGVEMQRRIEAELATTRRHLANVTDARER